MLFSLVLALTLPCIANAVVVRPAPTLKPPATDDALDKRCDGGECSYGGATQTLTANTITTTILSTTSVPCYITTYVTDSTTTTSTVYSTDIITSTVTQKGMVTVIKYQPTPVLKSSTFESVLQITQTGTTFWQETTGSAHEETITGSTETIGGGTAKHDNGQWAGASGTNTNKGTNTAWTHATAAAGGLGATTVNANGQVVTTGNAVNGGWANAVGGATTTVGTGGTAAGANGVTVQWNGAWSRDDVSSVLVVLGAFGTIVLSELCRHMG